VRISLIHSRIRQLCDKALGYLKDVIGTPAVNKVLYRLNPIFNALHWAGLTDYTTHYWFAVCYVFKKQSDTLGIKALLRKQTLCRSLCFNLPSSLRKITFKALVYSTRAPVSVVGTFIVQYNLIFFSKPNSPFYLMYKKLLLTMRLHFCKPKLIIRIMYFSTVLKGNLLNLCRFFNYSAGILTSLFIVVDQLGL